jgi:hypothetical protein
VVVVVVDVGISAGQKNDPGADKLRRGGIPRHSTALLTSNVDRLKEPGFSQFAIYSVSVGADLLLDVL